MDKLRFQVRGAKVVYPPGTPLDKLPKVVREGLPEYVIVRGSADPKASQPSATRRSQPDASTSQGADAGGDGNGGDNGDDQGGAKAK